MEEFVKLPSALPSLYLSKFIRNRYVVLIKAMAERPASHKYEVAKRDNDLQRSFHQTWIFVIQ